MPTVEEVTQKVQRILAKNFSVRLGEDGDYFLDKGSTTCRVRCCQFGSAEDENVLVVLGTPLLYGVPITDELCRWIAIEGKRTFGHYALYPTDESEKEGNLWFDHALLGNTIDTDELCMAVGLCLWMADKEDDSLEERFGGKKLREI